MDWIIDILISWLIDWLISLIFNWLIDWLFRRGVMRRRRCGEPTSPRTPRRAAATTSQIQTPSQAQTQIFSRARLLSQDQPSKVKCSKKSKVPEKTTHLKSGSGSDLKIHKWCFLMRIPKGLKLENFLFLFLFFKLSIFSRNFLDILYIHPKNEW